MKRDPKPLPEEWTSLLDYMTCGDIHPNTLGKPDSQQTYQTIPIQQTNLLFVLDHFCALVEEVFVPIFRNELNMDKFPQCVSDGKILVKYYTPVVNLLFISDIKRQVHELSTSVYQIRGHIKGKTLLPFPQESFLSRLSPAIVSPNICRAPRILTRRSGRCGNLTGITATCCSRIISRASSSSGDTRWHENMELLEHFLHPPDDDRPRRCWARTALQSWRTGRLRALWWRSGSGRPSA